MDGPASTPTVTFDQLSIILVVLIFLVAILNGLRSRPQPSMYPISLGMQSDLGRVRRKGESPIFRNTMGMLPSTPKQSIKALHELIAAADGGFDSLGDRRLPKEALNKLVARARLHLWSVLNDIPDLNNGLHPRLLLLISNPYLDLIFSLAAATLPCATLHIPVPPSHSISAEIQQACLRQLPHIAVVICVSELQEAVKDWTAAHCQPRILSVDDVENWFTSTSPSDEEKSTGIASQQGLFKTLYLPHSTEEKKDSYFVSFTSQCMLAGVTAALAMFPMTKALTTTDRVAIESVSHSLLGFEAAIAIAATYAGAKVCFFKTTGELSDWRPTVLVCRADVLEDLAKQLRVMAANKLTFKLAIARNLAYLSDGILGGKITDSQNPLRKDLRSIFTRGPITQSTANVLRAGLGVSVQQVYAHPLVAGPILATQPGDFQSLGSRRSLLHYGPPTVNIECKVVDVPELAIQNSDAVKGQLAVKGPSVTTQITETQTGKNIDTRSTSEGFLLLGQEAQLLTNGTVRLLPPDLPWDQ